MSQDYVRWPPKINVARGMAAQLPDATEEGQILQRAMNCLKDWRFDGIHFATWGLRPNPTTNDATGKFYPIVHYPPRLDAADRGLAIGYVIFGNPANGVWSLKYEDAVAGYSQETIQAGDNDAVTMTETVQNDKIIGCYPTVYEPPSGGAANLHQGDFKALELETTNIYVGALTMWHIENAPGNADDQLPVTIDDVSEGRIISENDDSLLGLHEIIGDGSDDVESMERLSRRVFLNESHPTGIVIAPGSALGNVLSGAGNFAYPAQTRDWAQCTADRYCYPALVIETDGVDATHTCYVRYTSSVSGDTWDYVIDNGEPDNTPYLITPMGPNTGATGSTDIRGLTVKATAEDTVTVQAQTDAGVTLTVHSWALFEGPGWT